MIDKQDIISRVRIKQRFFKMFCNCIMDKLLPVFKNMEGEAARITNDTYNGHISRTDRDDIDMADLAEIAGDKGRWYYNDMTHIRQSMINLCAAGMFHLLEQQLSDLCRDDSFTIDLPNDANLHAVIKWHEEHYGVNLESLDSWENINELRLIANTVKHGEGDSAGKLKKLHPGLFDHYSREMCMELSIEPSPMPEISSPLAGEDLCVREKDICNYRDAVDRLYNDIIFHFINDQTIYYPK